MPSDPQETLGEQMQSLLLDLCVSAAIPHFQHERSHLGCDLHWIADPVWRAFMRGEFDVAAFHAMNAVEVSVRAASGLGDNLIGVKLMHEAFAPEAGSLTDMNAEGGERVGRMELFAGQVVANSNNRFILE